MVTFKQCDPRLSKIMQLWQKFTSLWQIFDSFDRDTNPGWLAQTDALFNGGTPQRIAPFWHLGSGLNYICCDCTVVVPPCLPTSNVNTFVHLPKRTLKHHITPYLVFVTWQSHSRMNTTSRLIDKSNTTNTAKLAFLYCSKQLGG